MAYNHKEDTHNLNAPRQIVPILKDLFNPSSVLDVGCGVGTFLYAFKELGIKDVFGIDGPWVNEKLKSKYLKDDEFVKADLSQQIDTKRSYDLTLCLEVAEHIDEKFADNLLQTLVNSSKIIIFSAAVPYQSGQNHVNEQWPQYWLEKFKSKDYCCYDIFKPYLWNNENIEFWYKQNMFLFAHKELELPFKQVSDILTAIHPDLFIKNSKQLFDFKNGKESLVFYFKIFIKSILIKIGLRKAV